MEYGVKATALFGLFLVTIPLVAGTAEVELEESVLVETVRRGDVNQVKILLRKLGDNLRLGQLRAYIGQLETFTLLHIAAKEDNGEMARLLLQQKGVSPNTRNRESETPLHFARSGNMVELLIEHGAIITQRNSGGLTPLHSMAKQGYSEAAKVLLDRGADAHCQDEKGKTPLQYALYHEKWLTITTLLTHPRIIDLFGPLHRATLQADDATLDRLLQDDANINEQDSAGMTPLHWASLKGDMHRARYLLAHNANCDILDAFERTPLYYAVAQNNRAMLIELLNHGANRKVVVSENKFSSLPPRHKAAKEGLTAILCILLGREHPDADRYNKSTLLHQAAAAGHEPTVRFLLDSGANPNSLEKLEIAPLALAAELGHTAVVRLLLTRGAQVNQQNQFKETALYSAHPATLQLLLTAGAEVNVQQDEGYTPLHWVAYSEQFDSIRQLIGNAHQKLHDVDLELENFDHCAALEQAIKDYADTERADRERAAEYSANTILIQNHHAWTAREKTLSYLVSRGADVFWISGLYDRDLPPETNDLCEELLLGPYIKRLRALQEYFQRLHTEQYIPLDILRIIAGTLLRPEEVKNMFDDTLGELLPQFQY